MCATFFARDSNESNKVLKQGTMQKMRCSDFLRVTQQQFVDTKTQDRTLEGESLAFHINHVYIHNFPAKLAKPPCQLWAQILQYPGEFPGTIVFQPTMWCSLVNYHRSLYVVHGYNLLVINTVVHLRCTRG